MGEQRKVGQRMLRKAYYRTEKGKLLLSSDEKQGEPCWVLWEKKRAPVLFRLAGEYRHGIDMDDVELFRVVEFETTYPVVIVCEEREGPHPPEAPKISWAPAGTLAIRLQRARQQGHEPKGERMLYWARHLMTPVQMEHESGTMQ